ncbi:MAG: putative inorganic carbon transporter subunit DabA, partial [Alcanivoracaceae bacterium]
MSAWPELSPATHDALRDACARIAPSWPLDQLIAVNPFWEMRQRPFAEVAARMAALGQVQCLMDVDYYRSLWLNPVQAHHLEQAVEELGLTLTVDDLLAPASAPAQRHWYNVSDLVDSEREQLADSVHRMSWHEEIIHQISQFCGDLLSTHERTSLSAETVYQRWLDSTRSDRGLSILMREPALQEAFAQLPNRVEDLFAQALSELAAAGHNIGGTLDALASTLAHRPDTVCIPAMNALG